MLVVWGGAPHVTFCRAVKAPSKFAWLRESSIAVALNSVPRSRDLGGGRGRLQLATSEIPLNLSDRFPLPTSVVSIHPASYNGDTAGPEAAGQPHACDIILGGYALPGIQISSKPTAPVNDVADEEDAKDPATPRLPHTKFGAEPHHLQPARRRAIRLPHTLQIPAQVRSPATSEPQPAPAPFTRLLHLQQFATVTALDEADGNPREEVQRDARAGRRDAAVACRRPRDVERAQACQEV